MCPGILPGALRARESGPDSFPTNLCQMTNHYHIVIETPEGNLARGMRQLNGVYTQFINRTHRRVGHVFQGRYKAILVEKDSYLLELSRYVVLNPVRAQMVTEAGDWLWSSYRMMIGKAPAPPWLETDWLLGQFGRDRDQAIRGYRDFVRAGGCRVSGMWSAIRCSWAARRSPNG